MKKKMAAVAIAACVAVIAGCGSSGGETPDEAAPQITSWQTWASHYSGEFRSCDRNADADPCYAAAHSVITEMRQAIIDHDLEVAGDQSDILYPMADYQETYEKFVTENCAGGSREAVAANVSCNVLRTRLSTYSAGVAADLKDIAASDA